MKAPDNTDSTRNTTGFRPHASARAASLKPGLLGRRRVFLGRWQSGQSQQAVNLPPSGYGGSNPPLPTNFPPRPGAKLRTRRESWWALSSRQVALSATPRCCSLGRNLEATLKFGCRVRGLASANKRGPLRPFGRPGRRSARRERFERVGGSNSVVESQPSKLLVAGSIPVSRSSLRSRSIATRASAGKPTVAGDWRMVGRGRADVSAVALRA